MECKFIHHIAMFVCVRAREKKLHLLYVMSSLECKWHSYLHDQTVPIHWIGTLTGLNHIVDRKPLHKRTRTSVLVRVCTGTLVVNDTLKSACRRDVLSRDGSGKLCPSWSVGIGMKSTKHHGVGSKVIRVVLDDHRKTAYLIMVTMLETGSSC